MNKVCVNWMAECEGCGQMHRKIKKGVGESGHIAWVDDAGYPWIKKTCPICVRGIEGKELKTVIRHCRACKKEITKTYFYCQDCHYDDGDKYVPIESDIVEATPFGRTTIKAKVYLKREW